MKRKSVFEIYLQKRKRFKITNTYKNFTYLPIAWNRLEYAEYICKPEQIIIAEEIRNFMLFYVFDVDKFIEHCKRKVSIGEPLFYHENINKSKRTYFYADFDYKIKNESMRKACNNALDMFCTEVEKVKNNIRWLIETSTTDSKYSIHLKTRDLCFANNIQLGIFVTKIMKELIGNTYDKTTYLLFKMLDQSVYNKNSNMRIYYGSKLSEPNRRFNFINTETKEVVNVFNVVYFRMSILTNVPDTAQFYFFEEVDCVSASTCYKSYLECLKKLRYIRERKRVFFKSNKMSFEYYPFQIKNELKRRFDKELLKTLVKKIDIKRSKIDLKLYKLSYGISGKIIKTIQFYFKGKFCPIDRKDYEHKHNGRKGTYLLDKEKFKICCMWNPKCKKTNFVLQDLDIDLMNVIKEIINVANKILFKS